MNTLLRLSFKTLLFLYNSFFWRTILLHTIIFCEQYSWTIILFYQNTSFLNNTLVKQDHRQIPANQSTRIVGHHYYEYSTILLFWRTLEY